MLVIKTCMYCSYRKDRKYGNAYCTLVKKEIKRNNDGNLHLVCKEKGLIK